MSGYIGYVDDILLFLSVVSAPIILGALLFYGLTITERRHDDAATEGRADDARRKL